MELNEITLQEYLSTLNARIGNSALLLFQMANDGFPDLDEMLKCAQLIGSLASVADQVRRPFALEKA